MTSSLGSSTNKAYFRRLINLIHGLSKKYRDYRNISRKGRATLIKFGVHLEGTLPDIHARALSCASTQSAMAYLRVEECWGCPSRFHLCVIQIRFTRWPIFWNILSSWRAALIKLGSHIYGTLLNFHALTVVRVLIYSAMGRLWMKRCTVFNQCALQWQIASILFAKN